MIRLFNSFFCIHIIRSLIFKAVLLKARKPVWDLLRENPEWHSGEEDYDVDGDPYGLRWEILEDAYKEIGDSVQTSSFKKLSMISF